MLPVYLRLPLLLVRHAQSQRNAFDSENLTPDQIYQELRKNHTSVSPLTREGKQQALNLAAWTAFYCRAQGWRNVVLFHSPFTRASQTADAMRIALQTANVEYQAYQSHLLVEHNLGIYARHEALVDPLWQQARQVAQADGAMHYLPLPGGESHAATTQRMETFMLQAKIAEMTGGFGHAQAVFVIGHGGSLRLLMRELLGQPWGWLYRPENALPNAAVRRFNGAEDLGYVFKPEAITGTEPDLTAPGQL